MGWSVTIGGETFLEEEFTPYGYVTRLPQLIQKVAEVAGAVEAIAGGIALDSLDVSGAGAEVSIYDTTNYATGVGGVLYADFKNSSGTQRHGASIRAFATTGTNGSEVADLYFATMRAGTLTDAWKITGAGSLVPVTNDGGALGSASLRISDIFLASGAVVNFNNGDVNLTHSSNLLTLSGGALAISDTTTSTSTTTGSLRNAGGFGNAGAAYFGSTINVSGAATLSSTLAVTGAATFTSTVTASALIPTGSTGPTNGMYLPAADTVAINAGGAEIIRFTGGQVGVNGAPSFRFHVRSTGNAYYILATDTANSINMGIGAIGTRGLIGTQTNHDIEIRANNARVAYFTAGGGFQVGSPTGGDKGAGAINAAAVYDDNSLLTCMGIEFMLDGAVHLEKWDVYGGGHHGIAHMFAGMLAEGFDPRDHRNYFDYLTVNRALPGMPSEENWLHGGYSTGEMLSRLWLSDECQAAALKGLSDHTDSEIARLEARIAHIETKTIH